MINTEYLNLTHSDNFNFKSEFYVELKNKYNLSLEEFLILHFFALKWDKNRNFKFLFSMKEVKKQLCLQSKKLSDKKSFMRKIKEIIKKTKAFNFCNLTDEDAVKILRLNKNNFNFRFDSNCGWCEVQCYVLEDHHYPIRKKDGGQKIVKICSNCHKNFHALTDYKIFIEVLNKDLFSAMLENAFYSSYPAKLKTALGLSYEI